MRKLAIAVAVGAAALFGGSAANAADNTKARIASGVSQSTDMSSQHRHHHHRHFRMHRHWGHGYGYYRPYANSYGYYRQPYFHGGPAMRHGFGGGGWHHRHGHRW